MRLQQWMEENDRSGAYVAKQVGVSRMTVNGWLHGRFRPSAETLAALEILTGGEVRASDFVGLGAPSRGRQAIPSSNRQG
jgi:transcriptional regulator with XRE-family HTH domain